MLRPSPGKYRMRRDLLIRSPRQQDCGDVRKAIRRIEWDAQSRARNLLDYSPPLYMVESAFNLPLGPKILVHGLTASGRLA